MNPEINSQQQPKRKLHQQPRQMVRTTWNMKRRVRRFTYLMTPNGQLSSHPVMAMLWIMAAACAGLAVVLAILGQEGWIPLTVCAAILFFNMMMGCVSQIIFEEMADRTPAPPPEGSRPTTITSPRSRPNPRRLRNGRNG